MGSSTSRSSPPQHGEKLGDGGKTVYLEFDEPSFLGTFCAQLQEDRIPFGIAARDTVVMSEADFVDLHCTSKTLYEKAMDARWVRVVYERLPTLRRTPDQLLEFLRTQQTAR